MTQTIPVQSVQRGFRILELLAGSRGMTVTEIARSIGVNTTTAHNLLKSVLNCGYACNDPETHLYTISEKLIRLQSRALVTFECAERIDQKLAEFSMKSGEAGVVTMLADGNRQVVSRTNGSAVIRVDSTIEESDQNPFSVITGRVMYAVADAEEKENVQQLHGAAGTLWKKAKTQNQEKTICQTIKNENILIEVDDTKQLAALAIPITTDKLIMAVGTFMPAIRFEKAHREDTIGLLRELADFIYKLINK